MIEQISKISYVAGKAVMQVYTSDQPVALKQKEDNSPVTNADIASHRVIVAGLQELAPSIPILSEEDLMGWEIRQHWRRFWLIDPLDGTKEFLCRNGEFTVNIALIEDGKPVMGVVYAPVPDLLYAAANSKAWKVDSSKQRIHLAVKEARPPVVLVSRSHAHNRELDDYLLKMGGYVLLSMGSSLKFCLIAEGRAQFYPRFESINIWDTAAGHAIAVAAGAQVNDWQGLALNYTPRESFLNSGFQVSLS